MKKTFTLASAAVRTRLVTSLIPVGATVSLATAALLLCTAGTAAAATPRVGLGTADSFAVLAGSTVTNTGPSIISGDLGVSPGAAVTGFPPGLVNNGAIHRADAVARQAKSDLVTAYNDAAGRTPPTAVPVELGGRTLAPGVYKASTELGLTGTLTLDAQSDPDAVFIFQAGSTLITASNSRVNLIGGAQPCNVFWQVGSSATLGTQTDFVGTIMALSSITLRTQATVSGRVLARNGQVTLDTNTITRPQCTTPTTTTPGTPETSTAPSGGGAPSSTPGSTATTPVPPLAVIPVPSIPGLPAIPGLPPVITIPAIPGLPGTPPTSARPRTPVVPDRPGTTRTPSTPLRPATPQQPTTPMPRAPEGDSTQSAPGSQITQIPQGAVDTGDGSTVVTHSRWSGTGLAAAGLIGVGGLATRTRRR